jgi:eukaryotic-like serine/threonine-protein kinase
MPLAAGTKLGQYEILGSLGAGGMGEVYRARDPNLRRDVAIKILPAYLVQSPDRLRRFEQEAQAAAALNHPNILAVYQFGTLEGAPYLVSELLEGGTLREQLEHGPLPVRKAIDCGVQIAQGLAAAHEKGIVHRDLKPENLFVTRNGRVKILDFGLAKLTADRRDPESDDATLTHATDPGLVMGTVGYMSPEQVRGQNVDHRSDIFAFGAILYEMLTGRRAFAKSTSAETMTAILNDEPPSVSRVSVAMPPGLQRVVHRCLEKSPEQRFQSASDLAFALEALSDSGATSAIGIATPQARWTSPWLLWGIGAFALLAVAALAYLLVTRQSQSAALRVAAYTQITHDGLTKSLGGTDGSRLYFSAILGQGPIQQVSVSGGESVPVPVNLPRPELSDVSPDGSTLLVQSFTGGLKYDYPLWSARTLGGSEHRLGLALSAAFSPDGNFVVYSTQNGDLHMIRSDGTDDHLLARTGTLNDSMTWSPDGKTISYTEISKNTAPARLWEIAADGSHPHQIFPDWTADQEEGHWAPDGSFYFVSNGQIWDAPAHHGLLGGSSQPVQITSGPIRWQTPVPARDGKTIYASGFTARGELEHLNPRSGQMQPFLGGISADFVSFSRDGKSVAYVSFPEGILWKANADGSDPMQLTDGSIYPRNANLSADGTQILFQAPAPHTSGVRAWIVSAEGGAPRLLLPRAQGPETDPHWSPDARKIVFAASPEIGGDPNSNICILDFATRQVTVVPGSTGMFSPHWSPDGRYLVTLPSDSLGLNIYDFKTQKWSVIYHQIAGFDTWSKDSQWVYFLDFQEHPGIYRIRVTGGAAERVVDLKEFPCTGFFNAWMSVDANDAPMVLRDTGTDDIYALSLDRK